jgi:hypothetical protein
MAFMNYLAQLQQPRQMQGPDPEMQRMGMLTAALEKGQQWEAAQAEKARLLAKEEAAAKLEAEKRAFEQNKSRLTMLEKLGGNARDAGDQQAVGELYNQSVPLLEQTYGIKVNPLVGGLRQLTDDQVTTMPGNPADYFRFAPDGTPGFATQDFQNEQSQDRAAQLFGPGKVEALDPYKNYRQGGRTIQTAQAKPPMVIANGAGIFDPATNKVTPTGFAPPMTAAQSAADADRDRTFDYRTKQDAAKQAWQKQVQSVKTAQDVGKAKARINEQAIRLFTDNDGNYDAAGAQVWKEGQTALIDGWFEQNKNKAATTKNDAAAATSADKNRNASKRAEQALTSVLGGGPGYLAFSMAYPGAHAQLLEFYRRRGMGDKTAVMPYTGEQIREMRDTANSPNPPRPGNAATAAPQGTPTVRPAPAGSNTMRFQINNAELSPRVASILSDLGMA